MLLHYFPRSHSSALIPTQEYFCPSCQWDAAGLDCHGKSSGIAKEHGNAQDFALHSLTVNKKRGKGTAGGEPLEPKDLPRELECALGHMREIPADPIVDVSARSPWLRL